MRFSSSFLVLASASAVLARPAGLDKVKRRATELRESYHFIVAGGGTAGLTVADRLSEAFPEKNVLVVEYGAYQYAPAVFEPPGTPTAPARWQYSTLPIPELKNRTASVASGRSVGGSSCINGQFFDRGAAADYDNWRAAGSPDFDDQPESWDWKGILPFFKKSVTFTEPSADDAKTYGYTWDMEGAFGGKGPINSSYPPFQWPIQSKYHSCPMFKHHPNNYCALELADQAFREIGLKSVKECAGGEKVGICWVPTSQDPTTAERSHAGTGHYKDVIASRKNYDLLEKHKVVRVIYPEESDLKGAPKVEIKSLEDGETSIITATNEVVISAGAFHSPQILQRSGIGPADLLKEAKIEVVLDLPGVGYNFHDHGGGAGVSFKLNKTTTPNQGMVFSNKTFQAEALELYQERPAKGPFTLAMGNSAIYVDLPSITSDYKSIVAAVEEQIKSGKHSDFLPKSASTEVIAGYAHQLQILARSFADPTSPVMEAPFGNGPAGGGFHLKPLSRGTVLINTTNPDGEPVIDYRSCSNPVDWDILASFVGYFRRYTQTPTMVSLGAREVYPGANVTRRDAIVNYLRGSVTASFQHPCCTAAMMAKSKGGVVGPDMRVHGTGALSVVDASIFPLIPGTHTSATVYAVAEKAADIIIRRWKKE